MLPHTPTKLANLLAIADLLETAARDFTREARQRCDGRRPRPKRGATLRPSIETPLWNALAAAVRPHFRRRGDRALLARELEVHRARIGEYFARHSAMPDAERTLRLLLWLGQRSSGKETRVSKS